MNWQTAVSITLGPSGLTFTIGPLGFLAVLLVLIVTICIRRFTSSDTARSHLSEVTVSLPFGLGSAKFTPNTGAQVAAWRLYVELMTRVAVQKLHQDRGLLREALNSLYSLWGEPFP